MGSSLLRVLRGAVVAAAALIALGSEVGSAQPRPDPAAPGKASPRAAAKKLVEEGIAAYQAKDYGKAIALYMRAFSLDPHPRLLFNVGLALQLAGCTERAVSFYERYLTLEPHGGESDAARAAIAELKGGRPRQAPAGAASTASRASCGIADDQMEAQPAPTVEPKGRLKLSSTPEGMIVMLDGEKIGITPLDRELAAGAHNVVLVNNGRLVGERKIEISADAVAEVTIPVEVSPDGVERRPGESRLVPVLLWVGGGVGLAGSGVMFYLGQKGGLDHPNDKYRYPGATPTGVGLAAAGVAAIGVGVWLWVRGSGESPESSGSAPIATIGSSGGYLGWQGRF